MSRVLRCAVVDDDRSIREIIKQSIKITEFLELSGEYESAIEARGKIKNGMVDLIFLDVEMPNMSGLEFLQTFHDLPAVILITSKKEYSFDAFENDVVDFLLKPFAYARFLKAAEKALSMLSRQPELEKTSSKEEEPDHIFVKSDQLMKKLMLDEIIHLEALGDYVRIYTTAERVTVLSTLTALEDVLPSKKFMRVHRSHVVNVDRITKIEDGNTIFLNELTVPLSRSHKDALKERIGLYEKPS